MLFSELLKEFITCPIIIPFYSWKCYNHINGSGLFVIYFHFAFGLFSIIPFAKKFKSISMQKEKREGDYRFQHAMIREYSKEILMTNGNSAAIASLASIFQQLYNVIIIQLNRESIMTLFQKFHAYSAAFINYFLMSFLVVYYGKTFSAHEISLVRH